MQMHAIKNKTRCLLAVIGLFGLWGGLAPVGSAAALQQPSAIVAAGSFSAPCDTREPNKDNCGIIAYIVTFTQILSGAVGIIVTIMIVWGGIKYSMSKDNPQETAAAKNTIRNAIIALVFYFFTLALLNNIVPGGVL